jgi:Mce-associated membrane protein
MSQHSHDDADGRERAGKGPAPSAAGDRHRAWLAGWVLLAAAAGFAGWSGWSFWQTDHSGAVAAGRLRDQVLRAATREIADLNTVSDKRVGAWEARWLADTTGPEHAQVQRTNAAAMAQIEKVKTSSSAAVTGAAVTRLSLRAGTARVIAVVRVRQAADSGGADTVSNRYLAGLTRVGGHWKVSSITPG